MNKFSDFVLFGLLVLIQANAAEICGVQIEGAKSIQEARQGALASLAQTINSKINYRSINEETINGIESKQRESTIQEIESELSNPQAVKYNDHISSKACMSSEDAARPYLEKSKKLTNELEYAVHVFTVEPCKEEPWGKIEAIHRELKNLEGVLIPLGQIEIALKKNYDDNYDKAKKEYKSFLQPKGVSIESTNQYFQDKISSFLTDEYGCVIITKECKTPILRLKLNVENEIQEDFMKSFHCKSKISMSLSDSRSGTPYIYSFTGKKVSWTNKEFVCDTAMDVAAKETWEKIKGKINKGDCK